MSHTVFRTPVWLIAICVGAYFIAAGELRCSREIVASGWDKSAIAWTGFLPFMIPVWLVQAGCVVVPIALVYEGFAWLAKIKNQEIHQSTGGKA